jgi:phosphate uptake regulator
LGVDAEMAVEVEELDDEAERAYEVVALRVVPEMKVEEVLDGALGGSAA